MFELCISAFFGLNLSALRYERFGSLLILIFICYSFTGIHDTSLISDQLTEPIVFEISLGLN